MKVLLLGATGGCGSQVLTRLLDRAVPTTVIVRDVGRLPGDTASNELLTVVIEPRGHLAMSPDDFGALVQGCDSVVSCVGHNMSCAGICGRPRRLCLETTVKVFDAVKSMTEQQVNSKKVKFIVISTEGVDHPGGLDRSTLNRGCGERFCLWLLSWMVPPHADNMQVVQFLDANSGSSNNPVEFCAVRPSDMIDGEETSYTTHPTLQNGIFNAGTTRRANVGAFMADLVTDEQLWQQWRGTYPQLLDEVTDKSP